MKTKNLALFNIVLAIFIILWGAWVRLSGSGAGCGEHWPLCNGEVIPLEASLKTLIEFTHRLTTGIFGITVIAQLIFSYKEFAKGHYARMAAWAVLILTIIESLIGAVLVKKGLVVDNASSARAIVIAIHLVNTLLLMAALVESYYLTFAKRWQKPKYKDLKYIISIIVIFMLVGASGAIAALGNTLFPESSLMAGIAKDFDSTSHFLIQLRIYHPALALLLMGLLIRLCFKWDNLKIETRNVLGLTLVAVSWGIINWILLAPSWGALIHLALADLLWMNFIWLVLKKYLVAQANS
jgi:cytochrome c oxidase assembly protein subunit 15